MQQRKINPCRWQDPIGFSQAIEVSGGARVLYCAGQIAVDDDGTPVAPGDMRAQAGRALDNLERVLGQAGFGLANVVRLNYYVTDVDRFKAEAGPAVADRLRAAGIQPASTLLGVARLASPELLIEIEATAVA